jgi:hypothetical protein
MTGFDTVITYIMNECVITYIMIYIYSDFPKLVGWVI